MEKFDSNALAEWYEEEGTTARPGVQQGVTARMIARYVSDAGELPVESALPFGDYLSDAWHDYVESEDITQGDLVKGALEFWRGGM